MGPPATRTESPCSEHVEMPSVDVLDRHVAVQAIGYDFRVNPAALRPQKGTSKEGHPSCFETNPKSYF